MNPAMTLKEALDTLKTFLITKEGCSFCIRAIDMFRMRDIQFVELKHSVYKGLDEEVTQSTGHKTYPKIYINKKFVGGCSDLHEFFKREEIVKTGRTDERREI